MSSAPLAAAKRVASAIGSPTAPNGANVTGAAASAAASAATSSRARGACLDQASHVGDKKTENQTYRKEGGADQAGGPTLGAHRSTLITAVADRGTDRLPTNGRPMWWSKDTVTSAC